MSHHTDPDESVRAVLEGDRKAVAKFITKLESSLPKDLKHARKQLESILHHTGRSMRIAVSGAPGVGKSTFIESFGLHLIEKDHKVAVLAIDPSSPLTGGSILGDKTRMHQLSRHPQAFIRPSPASGVLGGVARKTRETVLVCEAAGFDTILVETVGVGQSEIEAASMVDLFVLLLQPHGGDELQGIKKGILEMADLVLINKADGTLKQEAERTLREFRSALSYTSVTEDITNPDFLSCSALHRQGLDVVFESLLKKKEMFQKTGTWEKKRKQQQKHWLKMMIQDELQFRFESQPNLKDKIEILVEEVVSQKKLPSTVADDLVEEWIMENKGP